MSADNSHAERQIAKRAAIADALTAYDARGGLANDRHARMMAAAHLALALRTNSERAELLLADALARRATRTTKPTGK